MICSMPVVPMLIDEEADSFLETLKRSKLKPYTEEQRCKTNTAIERILAERKRSS